MPALTSKAPTTRGAQLKVLAGPIYVLLVMAMLILPLPPVALDFLFTFNIALSVMVLLVALLTRKTLEFASFPTVLLFTTLLRLSLNVASTRVVLMDGYKGADAAGRVIDAFGHFMVGGNFAVGLVVFLILVAINFIVITKGATRIAEVGARFMLDAMPGKQMAIDADLNAGLIGEDMARARRAEISTEADFYGAMDGASKFVRGDAVAALVIMAVNLIGGLLIGMIQHHMGIGQAVKTYTLLSIGDGLVAQIPALVISTAAGITVSRVNTNQDVGQQVVDQLLNQPRVLWLAAGIIGLLGLVPGMPNAVFLFFTVGLVALAWWTMRRASRKATEEQASANRTPEQKKREVGWDDVLQVDVLGLEVGHRLIPLVNEKQDGPLLARITGVRRKFAQEMGFLPPVVHIRDNLSLQADHYVVTLNGARVGSGQAIPNQWLAINPGAVKGTPQGTLTTDPAFGLPAIWVAENHRDEARGMGYTVVDAATVVATHLNHLLHMHASELLGREDVQQLLDRVAKRNKRLVEDVVPKIVSLGTVTRVLRALLDEDVSIRDLRTILDTLATQPDDRRDVPTLVADLRVALARAITDQWFEPDTEIDVMGLDAALAELLDQVVSGGGALEPGLAETLVSETGKALDRREASGKPPVLLVSPTLRPLLSRFLHARLPRLAVLSHLEIPQGRSLRVTTVIGGRPSAGAA